MEINSVRASRRIRFNHANCNTIGVAVTRMCGRPQLKQTWPTCRRQADRQREEQQESRAVARKPRDAAAVCLGLMFADIHSKFKSMAKFRKPGFKALDIPTKKDRI